MSYPRAVRSVAQVIKEARQKARKSGRTLSRELGRHENFIRRIESCQQEPTIREIMQIGALVGTRGSVLVARAERRSTLLARRPTLLGRLSTRVSPVGLVRGTGDPIAQVIEEARRAVSKSAIGLSLELGKHEKFIRRIERGLQEPTTSEIMMIGPLVGARGSVLVARAERRHTSDMERRPKRARRPAR